MKYLVVFLVTWFGLLSCFSMVSATDDVQEERKSSTGFHSSISSDPEDPRSTLKVIKERRTQRDSLFPVSPLKPLHDASGRAWDDIYQATHLRLGLTFNHLFQWLSDALPDKDKWGTATDLDFIGSWEVLHRGKPTQGELFFHIEGRWDYGTTGPQTLGFDSLASAGGTANSFARYDPTFLPFRNLY